MATVLDPVTLPLTGSVVMPVKGAKTTPWFAGSSAALLDVATKENRLADRAWLSVTVADSVATVSSSMLTVEVERCRVGGAMLAIITLNDAVAVSGLSLLPVAPVSVAVIVIVLVCGSTGGIPCGTMV